MIIYDSEIPMPRLLNSTGYNLKNKIKANGKNNLASVSIVVKIG